VHVLRDIAIRKNEKHRDYRIESDRIKESDWSLQVGSLIRGTRCMRYVEKQVMR